MSEDDQRLLLSESSTLAQALMTVFAGDKLNIAALGNVVPQLHIHHIVRYKNDPAWPAPVWGHQPAKPYSAQELVSVIHKFVSALPETFVADNGKAQ